MIIQCLAQGIKMGAGFNGNRLSKFRCTIEHVLHGRVFAIQYTQWVVIQTSLSVLIEHGFIVLKIGDKDFSVDFPVSWVTNGIQFERNIG